MDLKHESHARSAVIEISVCIRNENYNKAYYKFHINHFVEWSTYKNKNILRQMIFIGKEVKLRLPNQRDKHIK